MSEAMIGYGTILRVHHDGSWVDIAELNSLGGPSGGTVDKHEVSRFDAATRTKEYITGLKETDSLSFDGNFIPNNSSQQLLYSMREDGTVADWEIILPDATAIENRTRFSGEAAVIDVDFGLEVNAPITISGTIDFVGAVEMSSVYSSALTTLVVEGSDTVSPLSPVPSYSLSDTFEYSYSAANADSSLTVTPTNTSADLELIEVNGVGVASAAESDSIALSVGMNIVAVKTKDEDKTPRHYTLYVTRDSA